MNEAEIKAYGAGATERKRLGTRTHELCSDVVVKVGV